MADRENPNILMEGVRIIFRNFAGKEGQYNREGDRNFAVILDHDMAEQLKADGWNVKELRAREDEDLPQPYLPVALSFKGRPPRVVMISANRQGELRRTTLTEDEVELLDWVDIISVDLIVRPYDWVVRENRGRKAYAQSVFILIQTDLLELKYEDVPEMKELPARGGATDDPDDDIIDVESWEEEAPKELEAKK